MTDIFDRLDAKDGFHIVQIDQGMAVSLHCQAYGGGRLYNLVDEKNPDLATVQVKEWLGPGPVDYGECARLRLVLDAVARYLTTGGSWDELTDGLKTMSRVALNGMAYNGYHLLDSYVTVGEAVYQHIFVKDGTDEAILWEEPTYDVNGGVVGGFIDRTTLEAIRQRQENDDSIWPETEEGDEADDGPAGSGDHLPVLGIEDRHPPETP